jgi:hypothetical protein
MGEGGKEGSKGQIKGKLCKYLTKSLTQIGVQGFKKLFSLNLLA